MNMKYYQKEFQAEALRWWRTLSINEMKAFEKQYKIVGYRALRSEIAEIYDSEIIS